MNEILIWTNSNGQVCETIPGDLVTMSQLKTLIEEREGVSSFIVTSNDLPMDLLFREAWEENGSEVYEDLEKSKVITMDLLAKGAMAAAKYATEQSLIGDTVPFTADQIKAAYQSCKADVETVNSVTSLRHCMRNFLTTYAPETATTYGIE